jgi:nucleoside phosphorylase
MITITFALPAESSSLVRRLANKNVSRRGNMKIIAGQVSGRDVEIVHTGVGLAVATARLIEYLGTASPALLITSGFAGGTRHDDNVGDIVLAQNYSDNDLLATARLALTGQNVQVANIFTSAEMLDTAAQREEIWGRHQAVAIDMETASIARICADRQLRILSLRTLSDTPQDPFPVAPEILFDMTRQRIPAGRLCIYLARHPGAIPRLLKFSQQIGKARRHLTEALIKVTKTI